LTFDTDSRIIKNNKLSLIFATRCYPECNIAAASRLSVTLRVSCSHKLEYFENNFMVCYCLGFILSLFGLDSERQSARMPKITNDGLTRSGTGCFIVVGLTIWQQWASKS